MKYTNVACGCIPTHPRTHKKHPSMTRRKFVTSGAALLAGAAAPASTWGPDVGADDDEATVNIRRLTWAGIRFEYRGTALFVDPITTDIWDGSVAFPIVSLELGERRSNVLLTHLHNDHYDKKAIGEVVGEKGRVLCHSAMAAEVASDGFRIRSTELHEPNRFGDFLVRAVPAVDGFGARAGQVSWVIEAGGKRFIHCGDTLWHGEWWNFAQAYGPFDAAYVPINGAHIPGFEPQSKLPATMTPEQAVAACVVMEARLLTPIHFGFHDPEGYQEYPNAVPTLLANAKERNVPVEFLEVGEAARLVANR